MLAVCAALSWEVRPVLRVIGAVERAKYGLFQVWRSTTRPQPVIVFRTGIGCEAAAEATRRVLAALPIRTIVNTGCAGALAADLAVGDLVIPRTLLDLSNIRHDADDSCVCRLRNAALRAGVPSSEGPVLTSPTVLATGTEKTSAHARFGATAVEMEGHAVATVAREHSVRFGSARAILDSSHVDLPVTDMAGNVLALALRAASSPAALPALLPLANAVKTVQTSLERLFTYFLDETSQE